MGNFCLKYKVATVHGIVEIFTAQIFNAAGMEIKRTNIGVIDAGMRCFN